MVKRLPTMREIRVQSLSREDPLEKEMATPLQYSCLENFMDRGALYATVHGVTKSGTRLSDFTHSLAHLFFHMWNWGFPCDSAGKESTCNEGDLGSIPGLGRYLGGGKGYLHQYSDQENSMDCIVHGVAKSQT